MKQCSAAAVISLCRIGIAMFPASCQAQTLTTLASFNVYNGSSSSIGLVQASDGNFYGTISAGGTRQSGTVFRITLGGILTTLYNFTGNADGGIPRAGLIQASDGNLYGTTSSGGTGVGGGGTGCRVTRGGPRTTLYSFCSQVSQTICTDGASPLGGLVQASDGNLYGTTSGGGTGNSYAFSTGTVFRITPGGTLTTLYSFCSQTSCADGAEPVSGVIQASDGNLYGTT